MTEWKAEMPDTEIVVEKSTTGTDSEWVACLAYDVRDLVTRANEELAKARAERDEARERLSSLSSVLGFGFGDDSTSLLEFVTRVEEGTKFHTDVCIKMQSKLTAERDAALARVRELEYVSGYKADLVCIDKVLDDYGAPHDCEDGVSLAPKRIRLLAEERDSALARVRELTEWRPMETVGTEATLCLMRDGDIIISSRLVWGLCVRDVRPLGWLPLPEPPKEDA